MKLAPPSPSFTLTEILAATAILSVMFTIMFSILQQTSRGWQAANRRVEASQVARLALDQIAADLENSFAVARTGVLVSEKTGLTNYSFGFLHSNEPASNALSTFTAPVTLTPGSDFIFVTTPYAPSLAFRSTDLAEVGYIPVFNNASTISGILRAKRYFLIRFCAYDPPTNAAGLLTNGTDGLRLKSDFLANPTGWHLTPSTNDTFAYVPIVDNCLRFDVQFLYTNKAGELTNSPTWGRPDTNATTGWASLPTGASPGLPLAADIMMCVLDERGAERLMRISQGQPLSLSDLKNLPTNWAGVDSKYQSTLRESLLTLRRRVYFKNAMP